MGLDIRYSGNQRDVKKYDTKELREEFLIEKLFVKNDVTAVYSHVDRIVVMGAMPAGEKLNLEKNLNCRANFGVGFFLERRELGIINIGGPGIVTVDSKQYELNTIEALYVSMGSKEVVLEAKDASNAPKFYMCSAPAHMAKPTTLIPFSKAIKREMGSVATANARTINQFIHPDVLDTCQLSMGVTQLNEGSVWNSMPCHTHERRMEVYMYFQVPNDNVVFHYMGEANETRHLVMQNEQAIISPSWSIHSGCGTSNYSFIWAMVGENKEFDDMDHIKTVDLR